MYVAREYVNQFTERREFLLSNGTMVTVKGNSWKLFKPTTPTDSEHWQGEQLGAWELPNMDVYDFIQWWQKEESKKLNCDLFALLDVETIGELHRAAQHMEAGDLKGAFQHLIQFACWSFQEYASDDVVSRAWELFGPSMANEHPQIRYEEGVGWVMWDELNEMTFGTDFRAEKVAEEVPWCKRCENPVPDCTCRCTGCGCERAYCQCPTSIPF